MSFCKKEGKDKSIFVTKEDLSDPDMLIELVTDDQHGIILPNGDINWDCPCLGGMAYGECGQEFKDAFSCFHYSEEEEKGVDCIPQFKAMQECFFKYPEVYGKYNDNDDGDGGDGGDGGDDGDDGDGGKRQQKSAPEETESVISDSKSGNEPEPNPSSGSELETKSDTETKQDN